MRMARFGYGIGIALAAVACGDDGGGPENGSGDAGPVEGLARFGDWAEAFDAEAAGWLMNAWGPSDDLVFAVGGPPDDGVIMRQSNGGWSEMTLPEGTPIVNWVHGFGEDDVWAVGDAGAALHFDGAQWRTVATPTDQNLWGVWGAAPDDVWAVGGGTTPPSANTSPVVLRWDGSAWSSVDVPELVPSGASQMFKVWGTGPDDVLIVGASGVILRWDGSELSQVLDRPLDHTDDYISLWGTGPDRIVAVGGRANAQVAVWDGQVWSSIELPRNPGLNGVWMGSPDVFYTVGVRGIAATVRLSPAAGGGLEGAIEQQELVPGLTGIDLHAVFGTPAGRLVAVGGNFAQANGPYRGAAVVAPLEGVAP